MNITSNLQSIVSVTTPASVARVAPLKSSSSDSDVTLAANATVVSAESKQTQTPTAVELQQAVEQANKVLKAKTSNELQFSVDKSTDITVVKMVNQQTGETLLQFPSEAMLQIARSIDRVTGAIIRKQA
ncbi:flagellar protein FlaG [Rhodoferax sp.]|uniref:flagellar protein FlaG n=1 Tax=Rhodoferax sp. TaxID=50421 RepID=UPI00284DF291|nr:flagellar protein FlaG [Rhodoferax sp.]MDR3372033.1 flagellar protein FlaG [Rhodoferax sp.]